MASTPADTEAKTPIVRYSIETMIAIRDGSSVIEAPGLPEWVGPSFIQGLKARQQQQQLQLQQQQHQQQQHQHQHQHQNQQFGKGSLAGPNTAAGKLRRPSTADEEKASAQKFGEDIVLGPPSFAFSSSAAGPARKSDSSSGSGSKEAGSHASDVFKTRPWSHMPPDGNGGNDDGWTSVSSRRKGADDVRQSEAPGPRGRGRGGIMATGKRRTSVNDRDDSVPSSFRGAGGAGHATRNAKAWERGKVVAPASEGHRGAGGSERRGQTAPRKERDQEKAAALDEEIPEGFNEQKTVADFEAWKASMRKKKADSKAQASAPGAAAATAGSDFFELREPAAESAISDNPYTLLESGSESDLTQKESIPARPVPDSIPSRPSAAVTPMAAQSSRSSRFTKFFSPPPSAATGEEAKPVEVKREDTDADGLSKIMAMLKSGQKSGASSPGVEGKATAATHSPAHHAAPAASASNIHGGSSENDKQFFLSLLSQSKTHAEKAHRSTDAAGSSPAARPQGVAMSPGPVPRGMPPGLSQSSPQRPAGPVTSPPPGFEGGPPGIASPPGFAPMAYRNSPQPQQRAGYMPDLYGERFIGGYPGGQVPPEAFSHLQQQQQQQQQHHYGTPPPEFAMRSPPLQGGAPPRPPPGFK